MFASLLLYWAQGYQLNKQKEYATLLGGLLMSENKSFHLISNWRNERNGHTNKLLKDVWLVLGEQGLKYTF